MRKQPIHSANSIQNLALKKPLHKKGSLIFPPDRETSHATKTGSLGYGKSQNYFPKKSQGPTIDDQFGLQLSSGATLKPKFKRIKNLSSGSTSVLMNMNNKKTQNEKEVDLDLEALKLKVCLRKEISYENVDLKEAGKGNDARMKFNDKKRKKLIGKIREKYPTVEVILKNHAKILNNWVAYVVSKD